MLKYSSILLIASICVFAALCVSASHVPAAKVNGVAEKDYFEGNLKNFFDAFSDISNSPNEFVKFLREEIEKCFALFDRDKKEIQDAVKEGTEMEKKIQDILTTLKNFTMPLPQELQTELETIEKTAADELNKLKGMNKVDDIESMKAKYKAHYETIKTKMESLSKIAATSPPVSPAAQPAAPVVPGQAAGVQGASGIVLSSQSLPSRTSVAVAQADLADTAEGQAAAEDAKVTEMETKLFELMKTALPILRSAEADEETISAKLRNVYTSLSKIRHELIKVERIQFHLLQSQKHFKADATPLLRSSLAQFVFAIMIGMIF